MRREGGVQCVVRVRVALVTSAAGTPIDRANDSQCIGNPSSPELAGRRASLQAQQWRPLPPGTRADRRASRTHNPRNRVDAAHAGRHPRPGISPSSREMTSAPTAGVKLMPFAFVHGVATRRTPRQHAQVRQRDAPVRPFMPPRPAISRPDHAFDGLTRGNAARYRARLHQLRRRGAPTTTGGQHGSIHVAAARRLEGL